MIKLFAQMYVDLEGALKQCGKTRTGADRYLKSIELIRGKIGKLGTHRVKMLRSEAMEIEYFRDVWPLFHGKLLLYIWLYEIELRRGALPVEDWPAVIRAEEN